MAANELFQPDNLFNRTMTKLFDILLLNILWLLCSIPVITIGASTTALYYVTMKMVRNREGGIIKSFFRAFKENFLQSLPLTLLYLLFMAVMFADFHILGMSDEKGSALMYGGCITILIIGTAVFSYVFPLLAKFENTVKNTLINGMKIAVGHPAQTLIILFINILPIAWFLISPETFSAVFWIWVFAGTGLSAYVNSLFLVPVFDEFVPEEER